MATSISIASRRNLQLLCRRLQATNFCLTTRAPEAHLGTSRMIDGGPEALMGSSRMIDGGPEAHMGISRVINGALPRTLDKFQLYKFSHGRFMPKGYDAPPFIHRVKLRLNDTAFSPDPRPDPDVFIVHDGEDGHHYFSAHSVGEDGTIKPKYYLAAPKTLFGSSGNFTGANCNGVFHFHSSEASDRTHYLWNPTKNWLKTLPLSLKIRHGLSGSNVEDYAFWCDQNACQEYKVLLVVWDYINEEDTELQYDAEGEIIPADYGDWSAYHLELYTSRTDSWMRIFDYKDEVRIYPPCKGVCLGGVYYWLAYDDDEVFVMSFDFATENISTSPLPDELCRSKNKYRMVEFKGLLGVFAHKENEVIPSTYYHYVRENGIWHLNYKFHTCGVQRPICFSRNGEVLYFESLNDELVMYNLATGETKCLGVYCSSRPIELCPAS